MWARPRFLLGHGGSLFGDVTGWGLDDRIHFYLPEVLELPCLVLRERASRAHDYFRRRLRLPMREQPPRPADRRTNAVLPPPLFKDKLEDAS